MPKAQPEPEGLVNARQDLERSILAAAGIPWPLVSGERNEGVREVMRLFVRLTLASLVKRMAEELAAKLGGQVSFSVEPVLTSRDAAGQARAVKALTEAGVTVEAALEFAGLLE